jgi:hypothetical protein
VLPAASALLPDSVARVVAHELSHRFRGDREEMRATVRYGLARSRHLEIRLVHQRGGVKRRLAVAPSSLLVGEDDELAVESVNRGIKAAESPRLTVWSNSVLAVSAGVSPMQDAVAGQSTHRTSAHTTARRTRTRE